MRGSAAFRVAVAPGGALAGPWVRDLLWRRARAVPSLDLDFANNKSLIDSITGQNLATFTRASNGTYVGDDGLIKTSVANMLLWSEDFTNVAYGTTGATAVSNAIAAPNGNITADFIRESGLFEEHLVNQQFNVIAGVTYTISIYAKAASRSQILIRTNLPSGGLTFSNNGFDLSSGTIIGQAPGCTCTIQSLPDGWYRCAVTATAGATSLIFASYNLNINAYNSSAPPSYQGANTSGVYFWGAQFEQSSAVSVYVPTTSTANSLPRFDHSPTTRESLGLLVEEARTNLLLQSGPIDSNNGWIKGSNTTRIGTETLLGQTATIYQGNGSGNNTFVLQFIPIVANTTYTVSVYARLVSGTKPSGGMLISVETSAGRTNLDYAAASLTSTVARFSLSFTAPASGGTASIYLVTDQTNTAQISIFNAQVEAGAFATSYIPTTSATVTRAADVVSITGSAFSSWYRQDEGTVFADVTVLSTAKTNQVISIDDGTSGNRIELRPVGASTTIRHDMVAGGVAQNSGSITVGADPRRLAALSYRSGDARLQSGVIGTTFTGATVPTVTQIQLNKATFANGEINGTIRRFTFWPQRLPNSTLQSITQ